MNKKLSKFNYGFEYPRVLSIAGSDSGGGAGIQADLKTFAALGCYGMTAITALTAQNTLGVRSIHSIPPEIVLDQIDSAIEDIGAHSVKIGMLHTPEIVLTVAKAIERHVLQNIVLDPVMIATSGAVLINHPAIAVLVRELFPHALLVTPNLDEASLLVGKSLCNESDMESAASEILEMGANAVLLKGGHLTGELVCDLLWVKNRAPHWMRAPRISTANTHGTGCTLSSAIAAHLALGMDLLGAVEAARAYVRAALSSSAKVRTGQGNGPLNHSHAPLAMQLKLLV